MAITVVFCDILKKLSDDGSFVLTKKAGMEMGEFKKLILRFFILFAALAGAGCAAVPVAMLPVAAQGVMAGASGGISYSFTNVATTVSNYPMEQVAEANLKALRRMGIEITGKKKGGEWIEIKARTKRLYIYITVEYMTPTLTRLKVNAKKGLIVKDKGAAFEIVLLTERYLNRVVPVGPELAGNGRTAHPLSTRCS